MPMFVTAGSMMACTFGAAPSALAVLPTNKTFIGTPAANIMDHVPIVNIPTFGMCMSPANPAVAAATTAALGVLTPMPCVPATVTPWMPGAVTVLLGGVPALDNISTCTCMWAGVISITTPAQVQTQIP